MSNLLTTAVILKLLRLPKTPSSYPLASSGFIVWQVHRKMTQITASMFWPANNTKLLNFMYCALGARIGSNVSIDCAIMDVPSLVTIGDQTSVGFCTRLVCCEMRGNTLFVCKVELGRGVKTEPRSSITPGSVVPGGCVVRAWACVTSSVASLRFSEPRVST